MYEQPTESRETESNVQLHAAEVSRVTEVVQVDWNQTSHFYFGGYHAATFLRADATRWGSR